MNSDGVYSNGCECPILASNPTCAGAPAANAPTIITGAMAGSVVTWQQITFPSVAGNCFARYRVTLSTNSALAMTVYQNCANTPVSCSISFPASICNWAPTNAACTQTLPTTYWVKIVPLASGPTCQDYSLSAWVE